MTNGLSHPRPAAKADIPAMTKTLVRSFANEPFHQWMVPDSKRWTEKAPGYFQAYIKMILRDGCADIIEDGFGAALWLSPQRPGGSFLSRIQIPFVLWRLSGAKFAHVWNVIPKIEKSRPKDPHWYLDVLGVDPDRARQGLGKALLRHSLKRSDDAGMSVFLHVMSEENCRYYERQGFTVRSRTALAPELSLWTMTRSAGGTS